MWLQLSFPGCVATLALALVSRGAHAEGGATAFVSVYADDDDLTVVSPQVFATQTVVEDLEAHAGYDADIITAATVDVRTAASPRGYEETRHGFETGLRWQPRAETSVGARWVGSWEPDYQSHGIGVTTTHEWLARHLTTSLSLLARFNDTGRSDEPKERWRSLVTSVAGASLGLVLDRRTLATFDYELQVGHGFMGSLYRFAQLRWPSGITLLIPEAHPAQRLRHAFRLGARRALGDVWFLAGGYRFYVDSWSVSSHTGDAELQVALADDQLILGAGLRGQFQTAASFYEAAYEETTGNVPVVRTADKLLAESWSVLAGVRAEMSWPSVGALDALRTGLTAELYEQHFVDFPRLDSRRALFVSLAIMAEY